MRKIKQGVAKHAIKGVALVLGVVAAATASFPQWARSVVRTLSAPAARAQTDQAAEVAPGVPAATVDAPTHAGLDAGTVARTPIDPAHLPGVHDWPRRPPPPLLTEAQVAAGLGVRLQHMQEKQTARDLRKGAPRTALAAGGGTAPPFDQDPPRDPLPPPASESLAQ